VRRRDRHPHIGQHAGDPVLLASGVGIDVQDLLDRNPPSRVRTRQLRFINPSASGQASIGSDKPKPRKAAVIRS
jgi:hypothetical protein